jgi:hypothetical protein
MRYRLASLVMSRTATWVTAVLIGLLSLVGWVGTPLASAAANDSVALVAQSVNSVMNSSGTASFTIDLAGPSIATVSFSLYPAVTTRSGLLAAQQGEGLGPALGTSQSVALACGGQNKGVSSFSLSLHASGRSSSLGCAPLIGSMALNCSYAAQTCGGVYPLAVTSKTSRFITFVTVIGGHVAQPLRIASLLTLNPGRGELGAASTIAGVLGQSHDIATDLLASPSALTNLAGSPSGTSDLQSLVQWANASPTHEVLDSPLVPIDPAVLSVSGLGTTATQALVRGQTISHTAGFTSLSRSAGWVAWGSPTPATLTRVQSLGYAHVILSDNQLAQPTTSSVYWGQPFEVYGAPPSVTAMAVDPIISNEMNAGSDPVLRAYQLLADLAFHHFERPSLSIPQGIIVMPSLNWVPSSLFLATYVQGLKGNAVLMPTTLSKLFGTVPLGGNGAATIRQLKNLSVPHWPATQVATYRTQQGLQTSFASATPQAPGTTAALSDSLLDATNATLGVASRSVVLAHASAALTAQLNQLSISSASITTTALKESIPITITSSAHYPISALLTISSDQLRFPAGQHIHIVIARSTTVIRIPTRAPTTGSFSASLSLTTPTGRLTMARAKLVVVASRTSIVAIILTIGALAVLIVWWVRTWLAGRKTKRRRH